MNVSDLMVEAYDRLAGLVASAVNGLGPDDLRWAPQPGANPIGWLVWHLTRVQDHHVAELLGVEQIWVTGDWARRFGLKPDPHNTGYGHSPADVSAVAAENATVLIDYFGAVAARTRSFLVSLTPADLDRVVDTRWDPPVTLGVRLVSVLGDDLEHLGQAAYVRGLIGQGR